MTRVTTSLAVAAAVLTITGLLVSAEAATWFGGRSTPASEAAVVAAATGFTRAYAVYDATDVEHHLGALSAWTTPTFQQQLTTDLTPVFARLARSGQSAEGVRIKAAGVKGVTADRAQVLVAADSTVVAGRRRVDRKDRWIVSLVRDGSAWSVDGFTVIPVGGTA